MRSAPCFVLEKIRTLLKSMAARSARRSSNFCSWWTG